MMALNMSILFYFISLLLLIGSYLGGAGANTVKDLEEKAKTSELKCIICNSEMGHDCSQKDTKKERNKMIADFGKSCSEYLEEVYGSEALKDKALDLSKFPAAIPSKSSPATTPELGWAFNAGGGGNGGGATTAATTTAPAGSGEGFTVSGYNNKTWVEKGFRSCAKLVITVDEQKNSGRVFAITSAQPRFIRTCSFAPPSKNCQSYKLSSNDAVATICNCNKANCNGSSNLQAPHWVIASLLMAMLAHHILKLN